jgi:hypothetical protein
MAAETDKVVYAKERQYLFDVPPGLPHRWLVRGQAYAADDPYVLHRPDLFTDAPSVRSRPA